MVCKCVCAHFYMCVQLCSEVCVYVDPFILHLKDSRGCVVCDCIIHSLFSLSHSLLLWALVDFSKEIRRKIHPLLTEHHYTFPIGRVWKLMLCSKINLVNCRLRQNIRDHVPNVKAFSKLPSMLKVKCGEKSDFLIQIHLS